ncbi:MAG: DUF1361 domain-containing protein [Lewinellaceae bacterium]|nr:DUF1361 domain-containing protein [Lewinellaceae bacterium]
MYRALKSRFRDDQQFRLFGMLVLASVCCALLVVGRMYMTREALPAIRSLRDLFWLRATTFTFLLWNLFLAWVPYLLALKAGRMSCSGAGNLRLSVWLAFWLAFLPNAPYIITDFVHFRHVPPVPFWYDLTLFFAAASLGLTLGLLSLHEVHLILKRRLSKPVAAMMILSAIGLCGFGVWLGRFQRWNSWDILFRPEALLRDLVTVATTRHELLHAAGITVLLSGVLLVGYGLLTVMLEGRRS